MGEKRRENLIFIQVTASSVHDPEQPGGAVGGKGGATLGDLSGLGPLVAGGPTMVDGAGLRGNQISGAPPHHDCVCSMVWSFHAIDATLSP